MIHIQRQVPPQDWYKVMILIHEGKTPEDAHKIYFMNKNITDETALSRNRSPKIERVAKQNKPDSGQEIIINPVTGESEKLCSKCKKVKPLSFFSIRKDLSSGYTSHCKGCIHNKHTYSFNASKSKGMNK